MVGPFHMDRQSFGVAQVVEDGEKKKGEKRAEGREEKAGKGIFANIHSI
jgi:hypothetical protein